MKVDFAFNVQQREGLRGKLFVNPARGVTQSVTLGGKSVRRDSLAISGQGRYNSMIESLEAQKDNVKKRREDFVEKVLEKGGTLSDCKDIMDIYDDALTQIDDQIETLKAEQTQRQLKTLTLRDQRDRDKDELEKLNEKFAKIDSLSRSLERVKTVNALKESVDSRITILENEIERDSAFIDHFAERNEKLDHRDISARHITSKEEEVLELEAQAEKLNDEAGGKLVDIVTRLQDNAKTRYVKGAAPKQAEEEDETLQAPDAKAAQEAEEAEETGETTGDTSTEETAATEESAPETAQSTEDTAE